MQRLLQRFSGGMHSPIRLALTASFTVLVLTATGSLAAASVTVGQLRPDGVSGSCALSYDYVQPAVASGNGYVFPATGTITSWSHNRSSAAGQSTTMKVYRPASGSTYRVVGRDGPRDLSAGVNTFPVSIAVERGDVLGLHGGTTCTFIAPGDVAYRYFGNLADGEQAVFSAQADRRLNVAATLDPSNAFTVTKITRNQAKGTATLEVAVPNPGRLVLTGKGMKRRSAAVPIDTGTLTAVGSVKLKVVAKGKRRLALVRKGAAKVRPRLTFTPTGGDPYTRAIRLKLRARRTHW